jgi:hypothetical protein
LVDEGGWFAGAFYPAGQENFFCQIAFILITIRIVHFFPAFHSPLDAGRKTGKGWIENSSPSCIFSWQFQSCTLYY